MQLDPRHIILLAVAHRFVDGKKKRRCLQIADSGVHTYQALFLCNCRKFIVNSRMHLRQLLASQWIQAIA